MLSFEVWHRITSLWYLKTFVAIHSSFTTSLYEDLIPPTELYFALYLKHKYIMSVPPGRDRHGREHMVVGFTTTYAINAYHYLCCEIESRLGRGVQRCVIKFVSDLCPQVFERWRHRCFADI